MHSLRPQLSSFYIERPRLLNQLPDDIGYVVHLEAPYGYGKSILAAQYATFLEKQNWRVIWAASTGQECQTTIAAALGLSSDTPWQLLKEQLAEEETILVLEDLEGEEDLSHLLINPVGITVLASRNPIESAELLELKSQNLLQHLDATKLALSLSESQLLIPDADEALATWELTGGWVLPLHVSSLTGNSPDANSLLAGIEASLDETTWQELLFLAALDYLPESSLSEESQSLVSKGFVQRLESSLRLHPYISSLVFERYAQDVTKTVREKAQRLPIILQGDAYAKCKDDEKLLSILENTEAELWRENPTKLVNWNEQIKEPMTSRRHCSVAAAHNRLGNLAEVIKHLDLALAFDLTDEEIIATARHYCSALAIMDNARGYELILQMQPLLDKVDPETAARFLSNASIIAIYKDDVPYAIELATKSLKYFPSTSPHRVSAAINLIHYRYEVDTDFETMLTELSAQLPAIKEHYPVQAVGVCKDIGVYHLWLKEHDKARAIFTEVAQQEKLNAAVSIQAKAVLAYLDCDSNTLSQLVNQAKVYKNHYMVTDMVTSLYIQNALEEKLTLLQISNLTPESNQLQAKQVRTVYEQGPKEILSGTAYATYLSTVHLEPLEMDQVKEEALAILSEFKDNEDLKLKIYFLAANYVVTREIEHLYNFLNATLAGARLLPGFIPISTLPNLPELSIHYPIVDVLSSGWQDAINFRKDDIPVLEINLISKFEAKVLGEVVALTDRQKQILSLLCIGKSRDEVAEAMWANVDTKKQRNNLNVQLNLLRKVIEPWGESSYLFEEGLYNTVSDYALLEAALRKGDVSYVFQRYKEPLAPGVHLDAIIEVREHLHEDVVQLLFEQGKALSDKNYLLRVLELEPLHEEALQALLTTLLTIGRRREARQRYEKFASRLMADMKLEPLAETNAILGL